LKFLIEPSPTRDLSLGLISLFDYKYGKGADILVLGMLLYLPSEFYIKLYSDAGVISLFGLRERLDGFLFLASPNLLSLY
jgi:hypothetical protein